jgi:23S rRNA (adenine2503-C2)-methyltransferase
MSPQRITVSTSGIAKQIMKLADDDIKFELAISLHTAINNVRSELMPINKTQNLGLLSEAITYFHKKTGKRITYEYLMLRGVNDGLADAKKLAKFSKIAPCKVNLIEFNDTDSQFKASDAEIMQKFADFLQTKNMIVNIRQSKGKDIDAACGQLANKNLDTK